MTPLINVFDRNRNMLETVQSILIPRVGEHVQLSSGKQFHVSQVLTVYSPQGNWVEVTVESCACRY